MANLARSFSGEHYRVVECETVEIATIHVGFLDVAENVAIEGTRMATQLASGQTPTY
jgi:hypothetical protein